MKRIIVGPAEITLSVDNFQVYLLVQIGDKPITFTQDIMPGDGPYNTRWAMEMVLRRFVGKAFDNWIVRNPPKPKQKELDIELDDDIIE